MARLSSDILGIEGRIDSFTVYTRNGKKYIRVAHNKKTRRLTCKQLAVRERQSHNNALWRALKNCGQVYMEGGDNTAYNHFMSINTDSPVPYLKKLQYHSGKALLLPRMVISDGPLKPINYQLSEVDNPDSSPETPVTLPALLTDLTQKELHEDTFLLYILQQKVFENPGRDDHSYLEIKVETLTMEDFTTVPSTLLTPYKGVDGTLALVGNRYADTMLGFAIVRVQQSPSNMLVESKIQVSRQRVVTNCTYYEQFTTNEAIQAAAKSYGGFTK